MYLLQNNVEVVAGKKNYCIYDLNTRRLYHLDAEYARYLKIIIDKGDVTKEIPNGIFEYFLTSGIIVNEKNLIKEMKPFIYNGEVTFAWIEITQNCNLMCKHCYEGSSRDMKITDMSLDSFKMAVNSLNDVGIKRIQLVGGEPLMHPNIEYMVKYVSRKFDFVEIFTNGTLLTDSLLDLFAQQGVALAFSLYAKEDKCHDYVTCTKGSFALTYKNIEKARSRGIKVRISSVEMENVPRFQLFNSEIEHRTDFPRLIGRGNLSLYTRDMIQRKLISKNTFKKPLNVETYFKSKVTHNCFGERLYIDCDLNVYPCVMERRVSYGNLYVKSIKEMINNDFARMTKDKIDGCKDCEFRYACYDCRPDSNNESINSKPWYCTYDQENGVWLDKNVFINTLLS